MQEFPRISIVTPSFNQAQFLTETIESILGQNYPNLEYIVIDGGSTDGSVDIIRRYEDRLTYWCSEKDEGQSDAINKGFKRATGDLLCWVNSDDVLLPGCLQVVAENYIKKKADLIHTNCVVIDQNGMIKNVLRVLPQTRFFMYRGSWSAPAPAVFFKASSFQNIGCVNLDYHLSMDLDIWMRMMKKGARVCHIPKYLGAFRIHKTSKTSISREKSSRKYDENPEAKKILDEALPRVTYEKRRIWRNIKRLYQVVNMNYPRSFIETYNYRGKHWKQVFSNDK